MLAETIPAALAGERLDRVVALIAGCSRSEAAGWVVDGLVAVDDSIVQARSTRLVEGVEIRIEVPDQAPPRPMADESIEFNAVYVDDDVIVVDKPAGLVVHLGAGHPDGTLVNGLVARFPEIAEVGQPERPGIVHRLDAGTSGLLVVARTERAYERLVADLSTHQVHREYRAVVVGHPEPERGLIDAPIGRSSRSALRMAVTMPGRDARTRFEVLTRYDEPLACALVSCELETGRTHQIRVHLSAIGHPVLGDATYRGRRPEVPMDRPFLHAHRLGFTHPATGEELLFVSELAADLVEVLAGLTPATATRHG